MGIPMQAPIHSGSGGREFWTVLEVAQRLGIHDFTVRRLCWSGELHATRIGTALRISETELQRYIKDNTERVATRRRTWKPKGKGQGRARGNRRRNHGIG